MDDFQRLLEQDLAKIILAIIILIVLLIIVVIVANISSKRKKAKLDNTRTLHKEEFEKAAKKRMELTQAISRDEIKKELSGNKTISELEKTLVPGKASTVEEKTMELNLDSVRRKLMQDEKNRTSNTPKLEDTIEQEKLNRIKSTASTVVPPAEPVQEKVVVPPAKPVVEKVVVPPVVPTEPVNTTIDEDLVDVFEDNTSELNIIESFNIIDDNELVNDNIVSEENIDFINIEEPEIDIWDDDFGVSKIESSDLDEETLGSVVFDDSEMENDTTSMFLSVSSISSSEDDLKESIEFVDVEDQSVYANNFEFGNEYYSDKVEKFDDGKVLFDFGLSANETDLEEDFGTVIFGTYGTQDYTYYNENILYPIFNNSLNEIELEDKVDASLTNAVVVDEELVIANSVDNNLVIEDSVTIEEEDKKSVHDGVVIKKNNDSSSIVVQSIPKEELVIDLNSQLDQLDSYEMDLLDEFDFADENYNYNFNSVNIMEEIVEDMLLDDFVEANDDEYFKYIYQFALLEDMIEAKPLDVNVDDTTLNYNIVDGIESHLKDLAKKLEEKAVPVEVEEVEESNHAVDDLVESNFQLDNELLDLTSQVMGHSKLEEVAEKDLAYSSAANKTSVVSPIFGGNTLNEVEEDIDSPDVVEDEYFKIDVEADDEVFQLDSVVEEDTDHSVDDFFNMISEKIETEEQEPEEEEFLEILKGLIK